jgi:hypothetical protein
VGALCAARTAANAKRKRVVRRSIFILSPITPFECCPMAGQSKALTAEDAENAENTKANERLCTMRVERFK